MPVTGAYPARERERGQRERSRAGEVGLDEVCAEPATAGASRPGHHRRVPGGRRILPTRPPCVRTRSTAPGPSCPHVLRLAALPPGLQLSVPVGPKPAYSRLPSCIPPDSQFAGESTNKLQMCVRGVAGGTVLETTGNTGASPHPPSTPTHRRGRRLSRETRGHEVSLGVGLQGRSSRSTEGCVGG